MARRNFFKVESGSIAIMGCLCLTPIIAFMAIGIEVTSSLVKQTRLLQAQSTAAVALVKEGVGSTDGGDLSRMLSGYMRLNMAPILGKKENVQSSYVISNANAVTVRSDYKVAPLFGQILGAVAGDIKETKVKAESQTYPLELVLVLDASLTSNSYTKAYREGARLIIDEFMSNSTEGTGKLYISMLAYSALVNIGWDYKDKLVTPESRRFYTNGQKATARQYGIKDILDENGPMRFTRQVCVGRKKDITGLSAPFTEEDRNQYADDVEVPPSHPSEGFPLIVGDGRPTPTDPYAQDSTNVDRIVRSKLPEIGNPSSPYHFKGGDVRAVAMVPPEHAVPLEATDYSRYNLWGPKHTAVWRYKPNEGIAFWGQIQDQVVTFAFECPAMPMVVGTNNLQELYDALDKFSPEWTTKPDEGLAWALRLLSPNWRSIWNVDDAYPADYFSKTDKKVILIGGSATADGATLPPLKSMTKVLCEKIRENGIEIHILSEQGEEMDEYAECAGDNYVKAPSAEAFPAIMKQMAKQEKRVRLVR